MNRKNILAGAVAAVLVLAAALSPPGAIAQSAQTSMHALRALFKSTGAGQGAELVGKLNVATVAALKALPKPTTDGFTLHVTSYYAGSAPDGGGGRVKWVAGNTDTADNGLTFAPDAGGTGRWKRVYDGPIDAAWFGALPSQSNNATALQAWADALASLNVKGTLPKGTLTYGTTLAFAAAEFYDIQGHGIETTVLDYTGAGRAVTFIGSAGNEIRWGRLADLTVKGGGANTDGIRCEYCGRMEFHRVLSKGHGGDGFHYEGSWAPLFFQSRADGNGGDGVDLLGTSANRINGALFIGGAYSSNTGRGVVVDNDTSDSLTVDMYQVGFSANGGHGIEILNTGFILDGVFAEFNQGDQLHIGSATKVVRAGSVRGSFFDGLVGGSPSAQLIQVENGGDIVIETSNFKNGTAAIRLDSTADRVQVRNNRKGASITNTIDWNGTLFTDFTRHYAFSHDQKWVASSPIDEVYIGNGSSGHRLNVLNNPATGGTGGTLWRLQNAGTSVLEVGNNGDVFLPLGAYFEGVERSDPAAPSANRGRLYFKDNGAGKTQLVVRFNTGAVQVIATEP